MIDLAITVTQDQEWQIITLKGELDDYQSRNLNQTFNKLIEETDRYTLFWILTR